MIRTLRILTGLALGTTLIAGCSGAAAPGSSQSADGDQTAEQACTIIQDSMKELADQMESSSGDEEDVPAMIDAALSHWQTVTASITNPEVLAVWEPIVELQKEGLAAVKEGDKGGTMAAYKAMEEKYPAFWEVCPEGAPK